MKHIIIGTAGHIDHGKTRLTQALTGTDTDRLKEEKARGITIENGFAQLLLPDGQTASIIDVPGHEKFVRNMIVGATGIDLALMVIAADDGFMPQTREHLDILSLLGVKNGIIALTKIDAVDEEWAEAISEEIRENVKGSFLESAPIVPVSSYTMQGIDDLKAKIFESVTETEPKSLDLPFRLPVDRVFTIQGFGTVATGTLTEGVINLGDNVRVYTDDQPGRVRELQTHDEHVQEASAGMRVAVNLAGYDKNKLERGDVIAFPGSVFITKRIDTKVKITDDCQFFIKNASHLHLFHGTSETICKIRLLDSDELGPGETGFAQLILEEPIAARNGDKFILRFFSPVITVGGGTMIDVNAGHRKRNNPDVLKRLELLSSESLAERLLQYAEDCGVRLTDTARLSITANAAENEVSSVLVGLISGGNVVSLGDKVIGSRSYERVKDRTCALLNKYHSDYPLRSGMATASFRTAIFGEGGESSALVLGRLSQDNVIEVRADKVCLAGFRPQLSDKQRKICETLTAVYEASGYESLTITEASEKSELAENECIPVYEYMCTEGILTPLTSADAVTSLSYERALTELRKLSSSGNEITLAEFRTAMGFSRKYAQLYLEYWDKMGITHRSGDAHILNIV